ncbi:MAG: DUF4272 domain-containing protein [Desulfuromonadales bacterium]|nr:DUF4272 domain-containing protein [Desulfuromonadales bacterium]
MWLPWKTGRPSAADVARRLVILKQVVAYAALVPEIKLRNQWSAGEQESFTSQAVERRDQFWQGMQQAGLWPQLTPAEREYAQQTPATLTPEQQINASWRMEAAQVLLWALTLIPTLPAWGDLANNSRLQAVPSDDPLPFIQKAVLRPEAEIDRGRQIAELWHWRSRTRELMARGEPLRPDVRMKAAGLLSYDDIVRFSASKSFERGEIPAPLGGDFPVCGKAYRELTQEEWEDVRSISFERHFAFNWLAGRAPRNQWDRTPTAT